MKKKIIGFLVCALIVTTIFPFSVTSNENEGSTIIYVDDDGTADYTRIQDAIDNASDGDFIIVQEGIYHENIVITKPIKLISLNREETIIDGGKEGITITILADNVELIGFTIKNSSSHGILAKSSHNTISDNIVTENGWSGIILSPEYNFIFTNGFNEISNNLITNNGDFGIFLEGTKNLIELNQIAKNDRGGIITGDAANSLIRWNKITNNTYWGVSSFLAFNLTIFQNHIANNKYGVTFYQGFDNKIISNNFVENGQNAEIEIDAIFFWRLFGNVIQYILNNGLGRLKNTWDGNYWNDSSYPYKIPGLISYLDYFEIPFSSFDWNPVQQPYDIPIKDGAL